MCLCVFLATVSEKCGNKKHMSILQHEYNRITRTRTHTKPDRKYSFIIFTFLYFCIYFLFFLHLNNLVAGGASDFEQPFSHII